MDIGTRYDPGSVEQKWYQVWLELDAFRARPGKGKTPFSIVIPPPNVTGSLHMGHALDNTIQDILVRWRRMEGYETLWLPGTDHAGIATQHVVEAELRKEGLSRYDLGREKFVERVWVWKEKYGNTIVNQLQRLGASCDWSRLRFTMDEGCSRAVREVFYRLFKKGLIYRGEYITNWCPVCHTALSDIEVEHEDESSHLWYVKYRLVDADGYITVATTRPETILGDTGITVHPSDERYRNVVGRHAIVPMVGTVIPIVVDEAVDPDFGTGAVKVTPAHDPVDFEIAKRNGLPPRKVIGADGKMTPAAGSYAGMDRYECRKALVRDLEQAGLLVRVEDHSHAVGHCYRCNTIVEPLLSKQWFVKMKPLTEPAMRVVEEGRIRFVPERFTKIYLNWLSNIKDWCISRQLWWGHRIPVWYCSDCGEMIVSKDDPDTCPKCGSRSLEQDPDVLDTWFSSALWPFSTMGWPKRTRDLDFFYPTSVLVTAYDIIFFWVARMIFMALEFTGQEPFREVFIHGLVRDSEGRKMSKSLGNGIDPLEVIEKYGADTLRFTLVTGNTPGSDMRFYWERVEASRNFANKIWNASRFTLMNLKDFKPSSEEVKAELGPWIFRDETRGKDQAERWILSRFTAVAREVTGYLEQYELGESARTLYNFIWDELCDWYIELAKERLYHGDAAERRKTQTVLWKVFEGTLRLLHPFMPYLTEEIWQSLPHSGKTIVRAPWPAPSPELLDPEAEAKMRLFMDVVRAIRNLRAEVNIPPTQETRVVVLALSDRAQRWLDEVSSDVSRLARALPLEIKRSGALAKPRQALVSVVADAEVYLPLEGAVDLAREIERAERGIAEEERELRRVIGRLQDEGFLKKAPQEVVEKQKARVLEIEQKLERLKQRLRILGGE
ncbi:MAG TPA: valine--tRNA ligase [Clostridia bacterium]|nr:valine--tRNA ligase [Clostridia bacterium]